VHGARLNQSHSLSDPIPHEGPATHHQPDADQPPYPFVSGNSLLALTKKHNVCFHFSRPSDGIVVLKAMMLQMTIAQIVHDNEMFFGLSESDIREKVKEMALPSVVSRAAHAP
jgi:hypothetical protein